MGGWAMPSVSTAKDRLPVTVRRPHGLQTFIDAPSPSHPETRWREARGFRSEIPERVST